MNQKVKWVGEDRELPGYGVPTKGDILLLPDHLAKSLTSQGLAVKVKSNKETDK